MSNRKQQKAVERKQKLLNRRRRIQYRLRDRVWAPQDRPMFTAANIHYELADRVRGLGPGGIGAMSLTSDGRFASSCEARPAPPHHLSRTGPTNRPD